METALDFQSMDDSYDFHKPLASSVGREPPATAIRPPAKPDPKTPSMSEDQKTLDAIPLRNQYRFVTQERKTSGNTLCWLVHPTKDTSGRSQKGGRDADQGHEGAMRRRLARK